MNNNKYNATPIMFLINIFYLIKKISSIKLYRFFSYYPINNYGHHLISYHKILITKKRKYILLYQEMGNKIHLCFIHFLFILRTDFTSEYKLYLIYLRDILILNPTLMAGIIIQTSGAQNAIS